MAVTRRIRGLALTDHEFALPLDHARTDGERIVVFAREVAAEDGGERPVLVFFQGGPGHEPPRRPMRSRRAGWRAR
jgi:Carboxypeptidase C (cathepsin A)